MTEPRVEILREDINAQTKDWLKGQSAALEESRIERAKAAEQEALTGSRSDELWFVVHKLGERRFHAKCISGLPARITELEAYGISVDDAIAEARFFYRCKLKGHQVCETEAEASQRGADARLCVAEVVSG